MAQQRWRRLDGAHLRCWAMSSSLNAISRPLVLEPAPRVARSRSRTVANGDSITLVVVRSDVQLHPEMPVAALAGLFHLGVAAVAGILGRTRRRDDGRGMCCNFGGG